MTETTFESLTAEEKELLAAAESELSNAYNPYNEQTRVGAAVRAGDGTITGGASFANASSTANLCAERVAITAANSAGKRNILALAMIGTDDDGVVEEPVMPCGSCRQFMEEMATITGHDLAIVCSNTAKTKIVKTTLSELLPLPYTGSAAK